MLDALWGIVWMVAFLGAVLMVFLAPSAMSRDIDTMTKELERKNGEEISARAMLEDMRRGPPPNQGSSAIPPSRGGGDDLGWMEEEVRRRLAEDYERQWEEADRQDERRRFAPDPPRPARATVAKPDPTRQRGRALDLE